MNATLVLVALLLAGQVENPPQNPNAPPRTPPRANANGPEERAADPSAEEKDEPRPFTLDELAAGAKNDAFVDEYLKDKQLTLFGEVQSVERVTEVGKTGQKYRLVMARLGHENRPVDVEVFFHFEAAARKDLALLEPGVSKVTVQGKCVTATLQALSRGLGFMLVLDDCKIMPTPADLQTPMRSPGPLVIPNVTEPQAPLPPVPVQP